MKKIFFLLFTALVLVGCGNDRDEYDNGYGPYPGQVPPSGNFCSQEVVHAYTNFAVQCRSLGQNYQSNATCRQQAEEFLYRFPGVNCMASLSNSSGTQFPQGYGQPYGAQPYGGQPYGQQPYQYNQQYVGQYQGQQILYINEYPMRDVLRRLGQIGNPGWNQGYMPWPGASYYPH